METSEHLGIVVETLTDVKKWEVNPVVSYFLLARDNVVSRPLKQPAHFEQALFWLLTLSGLLKQDARHA